MPAPTLHRGGTLDNRDGAVTYIADVLAVLEYSGTYENGPPNDNGVDYDEDIDGDTVKDGLAYDRSVGTGPNPPDEAGPPNGSIAILEDVLLVLAQISLDCSGPSDGQVLAEYEYDGQGALVRRTEAGCKWTLYIGGLYEERSDGSYVKYYSAFGRRIAMREVKGGEPDAVYYLLADHLGSSSVLTDSVGAVEATMQYYPYGETRASSDDMLTDKLFTGQQQEADVGSALGLYNYGARFYSTLMGRFLSPDPFVPDASEVAKVLGPALMVTQPSAFSGRGGDSVYGPVVGLMRGDQTTGLYVYVPGDEDESPAWPAEGFMPRQDLLGADDLNAEHTPSGEDEPSEWPKDTFTPNPQSLNRFAYVLNNPLRYTDPTGYGCGLFCDWKRDFDEAMTTLAQWFGVGQVIQTVDAGAEAVDAVSAFVQDNKECIAACVGAAAAIARAAAAYRSGDVAQALYWLAVADVLAGTAATTCLF